MGNSSSKKVDIKALTSELTFVSKRDDPRYGQISLYENVTTKEIVAYKEILSKSTFEFKRDVEILTARCVEEKDTESQNQDPIDTKNLVKIIGFATQTQDDICSAFYKIAIVVEHLDKDLENDIIQRSGANEFYTEEQLWLLMESLVSALWALQQKNNTLGDLKPRDILITSAGIYKLADPTLMSSHSLPGYNQKLVGLSEAYPYLSPALLKSLEAQELHPKHDPFKSEIFAAGLTLLHTASLKGCEEFYNWEDNSFSVELLNKRLSSLSDRYSKKLLSLIKKMTILDEENRPTAIQVIEELKQINWRQNYHAFEKGNSLVFEEEVVMTFQDKGGNVQGMDVVPQKKPHKKEGVKSTLREEDATTEKLGSGEGENKAQNPMEDGQKPIVRVEEQQNVSREPPNDASKILSDYRSKYPQYSVSAGTNPSENSAKKDGDTPSGLVDAGANENAVVSHKKATNYVSPYTTSTYVSNYKPANQGTTGTTTGSYSPYSSKYLAKYQPLKTQDSSSNPNFSNAQPQQTSSNAGKTEEKTAAPSNQPNEFASSYVYKPNAEVDKILQELKKKGEIPSVSGNSTDKTANPSYLYEPDPVVKAIVTQYRVEPTDPRRSAQSYQKSPEYFELVTETYADGSVYEGQRLNLKRHGRGKFYYSDGGVYDGDWFEGAMHGVGTLFYASGQIAYQGEWNNNKFDGRGSVYNENPARLYGDFDYTDFDKLGDQWVKYDGEFKSDIKYGVGSLFLSNGDRFDGYFMEDMIHGKGVYTFADGRRVSGEWYHNRLIEM